MTQAIGTVVSPSVASRAERFGMDRGSRQTITRRVHFDGSGEGSGIRIVVVDDSDVVRDAIVRTLSEYGGLSVVGVARDGIEAIEAVRRLKPDVLLMDISMPRMNGVEATAETLRISPMTRVIALTVHSFDHLEDLMRSAGAVAFIQKTDQTARLIETIRLCATPDGWRRHPRHGERGIGR